MLCKALIKRKDLYESPEKDKAPPLWIRGLLVLTCTGVSFAHGSNDGQKGMGLIMLILVGILPLTFAVDLDTSQAPITELAATTETISFQMDRHSPGVAMGGYQIAADELSAYLKTSGKVHRPDLRRHRHQVPRDLRDAERQEDLTRTEPATSAASCAAICT